MIDTFNADRTGWARFSRDWRMRFRLARSLDGKPLTIEGPGVVVAQRRVTFGLLNPSTANAFENDPTVTRCAGFARSLGADVYEVVNANALMSTDPKALYKLATGMRGDDAANNEQILLACRGAYRVIAGWGVHGALGQRGAHVWAMLRAEEIEVWHLGRTKAGHPKHPLYLKADTTPEVWR
jgi:hypothetical protein